MNKDLNGDYYNMAGSSSRKSTFADRRTSQPNGIDASPTNTFADRRTSQPNGIDASPTNTFADRRTSQPNGIDASPTNTFADRRTSPSIIVEEDDVNPDPTIIEKDDVNLGGFGGGGGGGGGYVDNGEVLDKSATAKPEWYKNHKTLAIIGATAVGFFFMRKYLLK